MRNSSLSKKKSMRRGRLAVFCLAVLVISMGLMGSMGDKRKPRLWDLINTKVRNATINKAMDAISKPMVDPSMDDGDTFSYFKKPSYQLGIRGEQYATQVMDGHLWTGSAEWLLLAGKELGTVNERIWTLRKGYLPCIRYSVTIEGIEYRVEAFNFHAGQKGYNVQVNMVKVTARNNGDEDREAVFAGAFMYGPKDHRCQDMRQVRFNRFWRYSMEDNGAIRGGKAIYAWNTPPDEMQAKAGKGYDGSFGVMSRTTSTCLSVYKSTLKPGESRTVEFVVPQYPEDPDKLPALSSLSFDERLSAFEDYWEGWLAKGVSFRVPEKKVNDATRSYVIHALMSQNVISEDEVEQHVNRLHYNRFWLRDSAFFVSMYEKWGYPEVAEKLARHFFDYQRKNGNFLSNPGQLDGWGQSMWAFGNHLAYTGDRQWAEEALPYASKAVVWLEEALEDDAWGLMPPTDAFDNEMITGRYTGHNFWALTGLDGAIDLAEAAGRDDLAKDWSALRADYYDRFMDRLREVAVERGGRMPPGLDVPGGTDWGNLLAVYPGHIVDPHDPLVTNTFDYIREERMAERIAMWQKSLHHYITERIAQTMLIRGEQEKALTDFYGMLLHTGSCHEGFEWTIFPWNGRDYCGGEPIMSCNYPPHGWYAACLNMLYRNMLIREEGEELHLFSALSPEWTGPGKKVEGDNAPTMFGKVSFDMKFGEREATLMLDTDWRKEPEKIVLHIPYYFRLKYARGDGMELPAGDNEVILSPEISEVTIGFERLPHEEMSYNKSVEWFKSEYKRRAEK